MHYFVRKLLTSRIPPPSAWLPAISRRKFSGTHWIYQKFPKSMTWRQNRLQVMLFANYQGINTCRGQVPWLRSLFKYFTIRGRRNSVRVIWVGRQGTAGQLMIKSRFMWYHKELWWNDISCMLAVFEGVLPMMPCHKKICVLDVNFKYGTIWITEIKSLSSCYFIQFFRNQSCRRSIVKNTGR